MKFLNCYHITPGETWTTKALCTDEQVEALFYDEDYNEDYDADCELPGDSAWYFEYQYNTPEKCPCGTTCTAGSKCGIKGT